MVTRALVATGAAGIGHPLERFLVAGAALARETLVRGGDGAGVPEVVQPRKIRTHQQPQLRHRPVVRGSLRHAGRGLQVVGPPHRNGSAEQQHRQAEHPGQAPARQPALHDAVGRDGAHALFCLRPQRKGQGQLRGGLFRGVHDLFDDELVGAHRDLLANRQPHRVLLPPVELHRGQRIQVQRTVLGEADTRMLHAHPRVGQVDLAGRGPAQRQCVAGDGPVDPGTGLGGVGVDVFDELAADHGCALVRCARLRESSLRCHDTRRPSLPHSRQQHRTITYQ